MNGLVHVSKIQFNEWQSSKDVICFYERLSSGEETQNYVYGETIRRYCDFMNGQVHVNKVKFE